MKRAILMSIHPEYCRMIESGKKKLEIRKRIPNLEPPYKVYVYQTMPKSGDVNTRDGRVVLEFVCDKVEAFSMGYPGSMRNNKRIAQDACLNLYELYDYQGDSSCLYAMRISDLVVYDKPKELIDFEGYRETENFIAFSSIERPPQSWQYVRGLE